MELKKSQESETGLNTEFVNTQSGRHVSLENVIKQIEKNNPNYKDYTVVHNPNGTDYVRSKPDNKKSNNIE